MKRVFLALTAVLAVSLLWSQTAINGIRDLVRVSPPSNPPSGYIRIYADNATGSLACKDAAGGNCLAAGGGDTAAAYLQLFNSAANTGERVFTPRDGLAGTDNGAENTYDLTWSPGPDIVWYHEEFGVQGAVSGDVGALGWSTMNLSGASSLSIQPGVWPNLGLFSLTTGSIAGNGSAIFLDSGSSASAPFGSLGANAPWEAFWVFKVDNTVDVRLRIGLCNSPTSVPANGMWLRYDTTEGDTEFVYEARASGVSSTIASGVAANTGFHKLRIRSNASGSVLFVLDSGAEQTVSSNVPTANMDACAVIVTNASAGRTLTLDHFSFKARVNR